MKIEIITLDKASEWSLRYQLQLAKQDNCLFGFLLESAEGLGLHSSNPETGGMEVIVSEDLSAEFEAFLDSLHRVEE